MNARLPLLAAAALSILSSAPASAADLTWTYTPNKDSTGVQTIDGITITPTYTWVDDSLTFFDNSDSSLQIGMKGKALSHVRYDISSASSGKIVSKVIVTAKAAATVANAADKNKARITASINGNDLSYSGNNTLTNTHASLEFSATAATAGDLVVEIDNPMAKNNTQTYTIYVQSITLTLKEASGLTQLETPAHLLAPSTNYFGFALSWDPVTHATNGYTVTLSPAEGNSGVTVSGTTATMTGLAEGTSYTASVVAIGDGTGTDDSEAATLNVTTLTDPVVKPVLTESNVSASSFTVSWPAQPSGVSFAARAWTLVPADVATEDFSGYPDEPPTDWLFNTNLDAYNSDEAIVKLDASGESVVSPTYPAVVSSLSFKLQGHGAEGSSVSVSGSSDGTTWNELTNIVLTSSTKVNKFVLPDIANRGMKVFKWAYTRSKGGVGFGFVSVSGTGVGKSRFYLDGYGSDAAGVPVAGTSVTISNPVAGETNYIEVTATGLSGKTASATIEVPVPAVASTKPAVNSVK